MAMSHPAGLAGAVDRRLTRRWTRRAPQPLDRLLERLTRAADHSALWLVLAAGAAAFGGPRGWRAAKNGVTALAFTSATVNGPLKLFFGRNRPVPHRPLRRPPRTSSFPSGHSASAFAFAVAAGRELPEAGPVLVPLAAAVAYSRVYLGAHHPSDVMAGAACGAAAGMAARSGVRKLDVIRRELGHVPPTAAVPSEAVLVVSPHAGNSGRLGRARRALHRHRIHVAEELDIAQTERLPALLRGTMGAPRLVIAAGGDGTIGAVAGHLAGTDNVLLILPLGTGNDFARALDIPLSTAGAVDLAVSGEVCKVDLARVARPDQPPAYFAHAATAGLNVDFAKLATRASVRARLGRLTYLVAAAYALRERPSFTCELQHNGHRAELSLAQLSVISAPVIGGSLGLSLRTPHAGEHGLDVLAVEALPPVKIIRAGVYLLLGVKREVAGVRAMHVDRLRVESSQPVGLALDGELNGTLPGEIETVVDALRVIRPRRP